MSEGILIDEKKKYLGYTINLHIQNERKIDGEEQKFEVCYFTYLNIGLYNVFLIRFRGMLFYLFEQPFFGQLMEQSDIYKKKYKYWHKNQSNSKRWKSTMRA